MKEYEIGLTTTGSGKTNQFSVTLKLEDDTDMSDIINFVEGLRMIYDEAIKATKRGDYIDFTVMREVYDLSQWEITHRVKITSFDVWNFKGYNESVEGIYLSPDTRYTDANHDLWLTKDILHDLMSI